MSEWNLESENENRAWPVYLAFAALTIPFFLALCERRQDCYNSAQDCQKDWNSDECTPQPTENTCRYVSRSYHSLGGYHGGGSSGAKIGSVSRGGFGSIGHAFSAGS
ncbi:hypothetical protein ACLVWU_13400 [Bdellovibrio sp. HCB290]|uniref:hypothetical protein n=1 Tax=Bdellovibrio sp. HCB290 TaxID=3394356 RepID=UPI0039B3DFF2